MQKYLGSMEGAVLSGKQAAETIANDCQSDRTSESDSAPREPSVV